MSKYSSNQSLSNWVRNSELHNIGASLIWNSFIKVYHWISRSLSWKVGCGEEIRLGIDPVLGLEVQFLSSPSLIAFLNAQDIWHLSQVRNCSGSMFLEDYWFTAGYLGLPGDLAFEWSNFILALNFVGIKVLEKSDDLVWSLNKVDGKVLAKGAYSYIIHHCRYLDKRWWLSHISKWKIPLKIQCFL